MNPISRASSPTASSWSGNLGCREGRGIREGEKGGGYVTQVSSIAMQIILRCKLLVHAQAAANEAHEGHMISHDVRVRVHEDDSKTPDPSVQHPL